MKKPRAVMIYKGWAAFWVPALSIVTGSAAIADPRITLALGALVAGLSGLNSYFDKSYGDSAETEEVVAIPLNLPPRVDPTAAVVEALKAKGIADNLARHMVAMDFEAAAQFAKGSE